MKDPQPRKKNTRLVGILVVIILILIVLGIYSHRKRQAETGPAQSQTTAQISSDGSVLPTPKTLSPFTLTDDTNRTLANNDLKGHWTFLFFGFANCGDVCPTTLSQLNAVTQQLQKDLPAQDLPQVIMVTVDPDRDTQAVLHDYVKKFNPNFIGARATPDVLNQFGKEIGLYYGKVAHSDQPNDYSMTHSAELYLINPEGNWAAMFTYPHDTATLTQDYKLIVKSNAKT